MGKKSPGSLAHGKQIGDCRNNIRYNNFCFNRYTVHTESILIF